MGKCRSTDLRFTFRGRVGLVTSLDNDATIPTVMVSFNEGRTSYQFEQQHVKLETTPKSMYGKLFVPFVLFVARCCDHVSRLISRLQKFGGWCGLCRSSLCRSARAST